MNSTPPGKFDTNVDDVIRPFNDNATVGSGSIVNEAQMVYNAFGQLTNDYQSHSGAVNTSTSPKVGYSYADGSANTIRPTSMTYPDGRMLNYTYGSGGSMADALGRIGSLIDDNGTTHLADYSYLGLGTFVEVDYTEPTIYYTLVGTAGGIDPDTGDIYRGLDRFGRIKDSLWNNYTSHTDVDRIKHGYDRIGNRRYRLNAIDPDRHHDEYYRYDRINRLDDMERGTLNSGNTSIEMLEFAQCWSLDATGNWSSFREDDDGDGLWDLVQRRDSNAVNEISLVTTDAGSAWVTPVYDAAGNMTTIPQPADSTQSFAATYDAWNRLIKLVDGANVVAEYQYDGTKRRTVSKTYTIGVLSETRHQYYTDKWQVVEERVGSSSDAERQLIWGGRYIDDLVLRDRDTNANSSLDERLYGMQDPNWNVTSIADSTGEAQERYAYAAYGEPVFLAGDFEHRVTSDFSWERLFAGYQLISVIGYYYVRNRVYFPNLGVWAQRDLPECAIRENLYSYVLLNPLALIDPMGLQVLPMLMPRPIVVPVPPAMPLAPLARPLPPVMPIPPPMIGPRVGPEPEPTAPLPEHFPGPEPFAEPWRCPDDGTRRASDCNPDVYDNLKGRVDRFCKRPPPPVCTSFLARLWFCERLENAAAMQKACADARREMMFRCFRGGDSGHQLAAAMADYHRSYCFYRLRQGGCPGFGGLPQPQEFMV